MALLGSLEDRQSDWSDADWQRIFDRGLDHSKKAARGHRPEDETFKAVVLDVCPHLKITSSAFENTLEGRASTTRHSFTYHWKNVGASPVLAFEVVTLKYDPFDEPMLGARMLVAGKNSADFTPLQPGESSGHAVIGAAAALYKVISVPRRTPKAGK